MGSLDVDPEGHYAEAHLLEDPVSQNEDDESGDEEIVYRASFTEMENNYVNYDTVQWILISILLILVYGVGIVMLLYVPIRRYIVRQDIRKRKLYVTANSIVYKVSRPLFLPCFGISKREKHILLHLVTDVVVEQGCLQSSYGVSSVRIEGMASHSRPSPGDDVRIQGMANPRLFEKIVLNAACKLRRGHDQSGEDPLSPGASEESRLYESPPPEISQRARPPQQWTWRPGVSGLTSWQVAYSPYQQPARVNSVDGETLVRRLEGIEAAVKRLEALVVSRLALTTQPSGPEAPGGSRQPLLSQSPRPDAFSQSLQPLGFQSLGPELVNGSKQLSVSQHLGPDEISVHWLDTSEA